VLNATFHASSSHVIEQLPLELQADRYKAEQKRKNRNRERRHLVDQFNPVRKHNSSESLAVP
jgi:hypothetical protein